MWNTRGEALSHPDLAEIHAVLEEQFRVIDLGLLELQPQMDDDRARIGGLFLLKGKNLAHSCISLALDGHGQESGALLRPLIEVLELSVYLRTIPGAIEQAQNDTLPSAGARAKAISGSLQGFREHLNINASHVNLTYDAMRHLIRFSNDQATFVLQQRFSLPVTKTNLVTVARITNALLNEVLMLVDHIFGGCPDHLVDNFESLHQRLILITDEERVTSNRTAPDIGG